MLVSMCNNISITRILVGTYRVRGREIIFSVIDSALKAGYRSIGKDILIHDYIYTMNLFTNK